MRKYEKETGRHPILGTMASESRLREQAWIKNGCNAFDSRKPRSAPLSFWLEQDILRYLKENNVPICSVYGDIVEDYGAINQCDNQLCLFEENIPLKTTGAHRTGCQACLLGAHLEKGVSRLERLKELNFNTYKWIMKPYDEGGCGYKQVIDWLNENVDTNIRY